MQVFPVELLYPLRFVFSKDPIVDEKAGQLITDGPMNELGGHGGIHPAGGGADHLFQAHPVTDALNLGFGEVLHGPIGFASANLEEKVLQDLLPLLGVGHLRVELNAVTLAGRIAEGGHRRIG